MNKLELIANKETVVYEKTDYDGLKSLRFGIIIEHDDIRRLMEFDGTKEVERIPKQVGEVVVDNSEERSLRHPIKVRGVSGKEYLISDDCTIKRTNH